MRLSWIRGRVAAAIGVAALGLVPALTMPTAAAAQTRAAPEARAPSTTIHIGIVADGPWSRNAEVGAVFQREILEITTGEFDVTFAPLRVGDWTQAGVAAALDALLADPDIDLVLALGTLVGSNAVHRRTLPKPVIAPFIVDSQLAGLPRKDGASGVRNLSYLASPGTVERDLSTFHEIVPFRHLGVLASAVMIDALDGFGAHFQRITRDLGVELSVVPVHDRAAPALDAIPPAVDAVYVTPLLQLPDAEFAALAAGLRARRLPSFSLLGRMEVERGILAGLASADFFLRTARRVALNVQRILLGEDAGTLPIAFREDTDLVINMETARAIGVYPSFGVLTEATLLHDRTPPVRTLSLAQAVNEALAVNRDLAAARAAARAGAHAVGESRARLLPGIDAGTRGSVIDADRALFGTPERAWTLSLQGGMRLFSEPAWAGWSIERHLQQGRLRARDRVRLDVAREAATAYLDVLRARTREDVQKRNLDLTRSNLDLARIRVDVGFSSRADLLRWESQIARNRIEVIRAIAVRNQAEIQLNRVLHHPLEEPFATRATALDDPELMGIHDRLTPYMDNPWDFRVFRTWMVQQALQRAPELRELDAAIAAQARALRSATRRFWLPEFALQADWSRRIATGGAGSTSGGSLPVGPGVVLELPDDTDWSVGIGATLPLFSGGGRVSTRSRRAVELQQRRLEREALAERIELRMRAALHAVGASRAAIRLAADEARAARDNLELVTDAYSRGVVNILDLLDAQNAALRSDLSAANAVYDYLVDWMEVERAAGMSLLTATPADIDRWFEALDQAFATRGARGEDSEHGERR